MPPQRINTPQSLEQLCMAAVFDHLQREVQLCNQLRRFEKKSLLLRRRGIESDALQSEIGHYLDKLPPLLSENVRQHFTDIILSKSHDISFTKLCIAVDKSNARGSPHQQPFIIQLLEIILNNHVRSIEFSDKAKLVGITLDSPIWPMLLKLSGLRRLVLTKEMFAWESNVRTFITSFLVDLTTNCHALTELVLKDAVSNASALQVIGHNCHHLRKLDLSGSRIYCSDVLRLCIEPTLAEEVADPNPTVISDKVPMVGRPTPLCKTLEILLLSNTNVRARGASLLLKHLPNLICLGELASTVGGIKKIYSLIKAKKMKPLKLRHVYFRGPSNLKLYILLHACPCLDSLNLGSPHVEPRIRLQLYSLPFKTLRRLTLENLATEDITLALRLSPNLLRLKVDCVGLDISAVAKYCPLLRELILHKEPAKELTFASAIPGQHHFRELQTLRVLAPISHTVGAMLFTDSVQLKTVEIVRIRDVDDRIFRGWLAYNPMPNIETLMIRYIGLTRLSVDRLIDTCPKLKKLGEMGGWDIRSWECRRIKEGITDRNILLDLVLYTAAAGDIYDIFNDTMSSEDEDTDNNMDDMMMLFDADWPVDVD